MIRAFIAVEIPEEVRAALADVQARLQRARVGVKISWTRIANIHLTLQFLGHVDEAQVPRIQEVLGVVAAQQAPFAVAVRGAGAFPSVQRPRVLWVGCDDTAARLAALAAGVQTALVPLGFAPEDRPFAAHLTLGRVKFPRPDGALTKVLDSIKDTSFGTVPVGALHLFESQLQPAGAIYTKLSSHALGTR